MWLWYVGILLANVAKFIKRGLVPVLLGRYPRSKFLAVDLSMGRTRSGCPSTLCKGFDRINVGSFGTIRRFGPSITVRLTAIAATHGSARVVMPVVETGVRFNMLLLSILSQYPTVGLFMGAKSFTRFECKGNSFSTTCLCATSGATFHDFISCCSALSKFGCVATVPCSMCKKGVAIGHLVSCVGRSVSTRGPVSVALNRRVLSFVRISSVTNFFVRVLGGVRRILAMPGNASFRLNAKHKVDVHRLTRVVRKRCKGGYGVG